MLNIKKINKKIIVQNKIKGICPPGWVYDGEHCIGPWQIKKGVQ